jgi:hypothetical protein
MKDRKVKQVLIGDGYQWASGGHKERLRRTNMVDVFCIHV